MEARKIDAEIVTRKVSWTETITNKELRKSMTHNNVVDAILKSYPLREKYKAGGIFPGWVLPFVAYPKQGEGLGETICFGGATFPIPDDVLREYGGKKDTLLVLDEGFDAGPDLMIKGKVVKVLTVHRDEEWRMPDLETGIPQGQSVPYNTADALVGYFKDGPYIGALARGFNDLYDGRRTVYATIGNEWALGVASYESQAGIERTHLLRKDSMELEEFVARMENGEGINCGTYRIGKEDFEFLKGLAKTLQTTDGK